MIINRNEYFNFFNKNKNLSIYNAFNRVNGLGKTARIIKFLYKNLGLNINQNYSLKLLSAKQHSINVFILTVYYQKKLSFFVSKLKIYYKQLKHVSGSFRFIQHSHGLPINGQRSRTNARTSKRLRFPVKKKQHVKKNKH
jgi:ribosomal protein S13